MISFNKFTITEYLIFGTNKNCHFSPQKNWNANTAQVRNDHNHVWKFLYQISKYLVGSKWFSHRKKEIIMPIITDLAIGCKCSKVNDLSNSYLLWLWNLDKFFTICFNRNSTRNSKQVDWSSYADKLEIIMQKIKPQNIKKSSEL